MRILVVVSAARAGEVSGPGVTVVGYSTVREAVEGLQTPADAAVLYSGLPPESQPALAAAVREGGRPVIEVRGERWDGETQSELSAACRGVISGFGFGGVAAAIALLGREAAG
jgi:3-dehydroquinate dehydratase